MLCLAQYWHERQPARRLQLRRRSRKRQGLKIACLEEIAYLNEIINADQLKELASNFNRDYGEYISSLIISLPRRSNAYSHAHQRKRDHRIDAKHAQQHAEIKNWSHGVRLPARTVGHASGLAIACEITHGYRLDHRLGSQFVRPQQITNTVTQAGVRHWGLIGRYVYVGYLAALHATQEFDILIAHEEIDSANSSIQAVVMKSGKCFNSQSM